MKKLLKLSHFILISVALLIPLFIGASVFAQTGYMPPTILPAEDTNIGGSEGVCIGLATMIKTGNIHLRNIPCFIKYITETLVALAGSISVIFVMIGGYKYVILSDEKKEEAKKTITYALIGLAISLMAWIIIDLVIKIATE